MLFARLLCVGALLLVHVVHPSPFSRGLTNTTKSIEDLQRRAPDDTFLGRRWIDQQDRRGADPGDEEYKRSVRRSWDLGSRSYTSALKTFSHLVKDNVLRREVQPTDLVIAVGNSVR